MLLPRLDKYERASLDSEPFRSIEKQSRASRHKIQFIAGVRLLPILTLRRV